MFRRYKLKNFDFLLVLLVIALNVIGILAIGSAKQSVQSKQILGMAVGLDCHAGNRLLDYSRLLKLAWIGYLFVIVTPHSGSFFSEGRQTVRRAGSIWAFLTFSRQKLQKILLILFYAQFIMKYREQFNTMRVLLLAVLFIIPPLILIYKQPNSSNDDSGVCFILCPDVCRRLELEDHRGRSRSGGSVRSYFSVHCHAGGTDADKAIISGIVLWHF